MSGMLQRAFAALSFALVCIALPASAQEIVRIRGTIERIEGPVYVVKNREGAELKLTLTDNPLFVAISPSTHGRHQAGHVRRLGRNDATRRHPEGDRGAYFPGIDARHRRRPLRLGSQAPEQDDQWQCRADRSGVDGPVLSVKYKDGEKKLVVTPETVVVTYVLGNKDEVKPGTKIFVAAKKQPDGTLQAPASPTAGMARGRRSDCDVKIPLLSEF